MSNLEFRNQKENFFSSLKNRLTSIDKNFNKNNIVLSIKDDSILPTTLKQVIYNLDDNNQKKNNFEYCFAVHEEQKKYFLELMQNSEYLPNKSDQISEEEFQARQMIAIIRHNLKLLGKGKNDNEFCFTHKIILSRRIKVEKYTVYGDKEDVTMIMDVIQFLHTQDSALQCE